MSGGLAADGGRPFYFGRIMYSRIICDFESLAAMSGGLAADGGLGVGVWQNSQFLSDIRGTLCHPWDPSVRHLWEFSPVRYPWDALPSVGSLCPVSVGILSCPISVGRFAIRGIPLSGICGNSLLSDIRGTLCHPWDPSVRYPWACHAIRGCPPRDRRRGGHRSGGRLLWIGFRTHPI